MTTEPCAESVAETEHTVSEARLCVVCSSPLIGRRRQAQHCSDRCRAEAARTARRRRVTARLDEIATAVTALRRELRLDEESPTYDATAREVLR